MEAESAMSLCMVIQHTLIVCNVFVAQNVFKMMQMFFAKVMHVTYYYAFALLWLRKENTIAIYFVYHSLTASVK